jgi:tRNA G46 methylase TrmB
VEKNIINKQQPHWEKVFENSGSRFGGEPGCPARKAAVIFEKERKKKILELGSGQGRDTCFLSVKAFMYIRLITPKKG